MNRHAAGAAALALFAIVAIAACGGNNIGGGGMGGGPACGPCSYVFTNGGIACADGPGGPAATWETLAHCACGLGPCNGDCAASFCLSMPADMMCSACLGSSCSAQLMACSAN
jgi:hypothetical protein